MKFLPTVSAAVLCVMPIAVSAHHSRAHFSGEFQEIEGEIVSLSWGNPHTGIFLKTLNEQGEEETWRVDSLGTGGLTRDSFATGQRLTIAGPVSTGGVWTVLRPPRTSLRHHCATRWATGREIPWWWRRRA